MHKSQQKDHESKLGCSILPYHIHDENFYLTMISSETEYVSVKRLH